MLAYLRKLAPGKKFIADFDGRWEGSEQSFKRQGGGFGKADGEKWVDEFRGFN